jgi:hypothetical protein
MYNIDPNDEEVFIGSGLTWGIVGEASGAVQASEPRRSNRSITSKAPMENIDEEPFLSDDDSEEEDAHFDLDDSE